ncbi:MAG: helix-turn-helix domain-containing protein [Bacteroidales bacterium]|nr:helix-turn-helix domain-containing protein [Bacteroidales bacterium]
MKKTLLLIVSLCSAGLLQAQSPTLYSTGQGLISTRIGEICFDHNDFLWIATNQGLSRFDGQSFTTYQRQTGNPYSLQENHVTCLYEDANGDHWVGAADGLYHFDPAENRMTHFALDSMTHYICVSRIVPNPVRPNTMLVGTYGYGIFIFDTQKRAVDRINTRLLQPVLKRWNCQHLITDSHNRLWIATPTSLQCIDLAGLIDMPLKGILAGGQEIIVQDMVEDVRHNCLYLATLHAGLLCVDLNTLNVARIDLPELNNCNLSSLHYYPDGTLLVGTECQGLWSVQSGKATRVVVDECPVDLNRVKIHSIATDAQNDLWLGLYQKGVLVIPHRQRLFSHRAIHAEGQTFNLGSVATFASMSDGSRIYGIDGEGIVHVKADGSVSHINSSNSVLSSDAVLSLAALPGNLAYVGTYNCGIYLYDGRQLRRDPQLSLLDRQSIMTMVLDSLAQTLYIGTNGDGIYAFNIATRHLRRVSGERHLLWIVSLSIDRRHRLWASTEGSITCFDLERKNRFSPLFDQPVRAYGCVEDPNGALWFATDHGLLSYTSGSDSMQMVMADGKPLDNAIFSVLCSRDGQIWMPSSQGLVCYDPRNASATRFVDPQISAVSSFGARAAIAWPNGNFCFGGDNGVVEFSPDAVNSDHRTLRPIHFTRLWVNNVPTDYNPQLPVGDNLLDKSLWTASELHLPASVNSFAISFAMQDYSRPQGSRYFYWLEGYDKDWNEVFGIDNTATYSSLPWGRYTLHVRAALTDGAGQTQSVTKTLEVVIDAPWYASVWAIIIYTLLFAAVVFGVVTFLRNRAHQRRVMRRTEHNRQIKEAKLRMFTSVSHEIKTPLTLIISPLRRLMQRNVDNATQSAYEMMYRSSLRILMLVNQQMDIRRIDNGQLNLHVSEGSLNSFLSDVMQYFNNTAISRQIDFTLNFGDEQDDAMLWFDAGQLDKVFFNLLSNAFKYVPDGGRVAINVKANDSAKTISIEVYNSGSHLSQTDTRLLFERFGAEGSIGLGLSLANELVELHHGTLSARNEADGVTFCVTMPMGSQHFTAEELKPVEHPHATEQDQLELEARAMRGDSTDEPSADGKELIDLLNDELREKQRMRKRRTDLHFDFGGKELTSADERLLNRVAECISKNMGDPDLDVDFLASEVSISRVHLNRKLKELIDMSPSTLIKTTRLKQAASLLVQKNVTIAEVAYSVGYSSPAYFTSNFTSYFNMTPREFVSTYTNDPDNPELKRLLE